jgi:hydrogenase nickel incorporation protein HypA/HybF
MHEMAVTQAMLDMALEHAQGRRITDVYLQVGRMSAIVPDSVEVFFEYLSEGTLAEGAELHFDIVPMEMTCSACERTLDLEAWEEERPHIIMQKAFAEGCPCGSKDLRVSNGVSFGLVSIEVDAESGG